MISGQEQKANNNGIPREIKVFLLKGLAVLISWELLYNLLLKPIRVPDRVLTNITAAVTAKMVSVFYAPATTLLNAVKAIISVNGHKVLGVADPCNALEIYVLYIAFLFCYPAHNRRRFLFLLIGIPLIFVVNIIRCCLLVWLNMKHRNWFDISHHYIFTAIVYLLVFYLWMLFSKKKNAHAA